MSRHADMVFLIGGGRNRVDAARTAMVLFSDTSAAAVTCAIMKPELTPLLSTKNAGRPLILGSTNTAIRRSDRLPISAIASANVSAANATGSA